MNNFILKQLHKKRVMLLTFLIVCGLFTCEKAFAEWGKKCCQLFYNPVENQIRIDFKFFDFGSKRTKKFSFLETFVVQYSTDGGNKYTHLMSSWTIDQAEKDWAWIGMKSKNHGEKIDLLYYPFQQEAQMTTHWEDNQRPVLKVKNHSIYY